ncbi:cysteine desulfurase family protein [Sphingorhabdus wooponensis]|jgi:cysteine desulfurase|uniref:Cysteine desulfurase n=1 Tax=Sphingorhabdus wooponensis TaxID=940136 RepID=A0A426RSU1_9SPHN|nr:cysteine desulfurase family protein [Sphingorhabdus wooponensis]RRQ51976.1 cysteine desulfurase [Sphingorhabdus wooponensis]
MIYLDYQATTPLAPEAFTAMEPWLKSGFANPHSAHAAGRAAAAAVEVARDQVAALLPPGGRVIFTSGATEAINLAILGCGLSVSAAATEHAAVLDCVQYLGGDVLPVGTDGLVDHVKTHAALQAIMLVNNEIGTIQPIADLAAAAHAQNKLFLCDAVQAFGRMPIPDGPDMIAVSAHKIHGPKGIGALWVRDGVSLAPHMLGGGQEQGMRSGTLSTALCAGFGAAAKLAAERMEADAAHVAMLWNRARAAFADWTINGATTERYKGNLNIRRDGIDAGRLISECRNIAFSAGSACASGSGRPSHVLRAIGLTDAQAKSSIRLGFGRYTTVEEIDIAAKAINQAAEAML